MEQALKPTNINQTPSPAKKSSLLSGTELIMTILLLFFIYHLSRQAAMLTSATVSPSAKAASNPVVVIDSGHGGTFHRPKN